MEVGGVEPNSLYRKKMKCFESFSYFIIRPRVALAML